VKLSLKTRLSWSGFLFVDLLLNIILLMKALKTSWPYFEYTILIGLKIIKSLNFCERFREIEKDKHRQLYTTFRSVGRI